MKTNKTNFENDVASALTAIGKGCNMADLARYADIPYARLYNYIKKIRRGASMNKAILLFFLFDLAKGISSLIKKETGTLLNSWLVEMGYESISEERIKDLETGAKRRRELATERARREAEEARTSNRPEYYVGGGFVPSMKVTYSLEDEKKDVELVEKARATGTGLDGALYVYDRLSLTFRNSEIKFTEDEAVKMEMLHSIEKLGQAENLYDLFYSCSDVGKWLLPSHPRVQSFREGSHRNRIYFIEESKKKSILTTLNISDESIKNILEDRYLAIIKSLVERLDTLSEYGHAGTMCEIKELIEVSGISWELTGITYSELMIKTEKSMLELARDHIKKCSDKNSEDLTSALEIAKEWGFSWEQIGITPKHAARIIVLSHLNEIVEDEGGKIEKCSLSGLRESIREILAGI